MNKSNFKFALLFFIIYFIEIVLVVLLFDIVNHQHATEKIYLAVFCGIAFSIYFYFFSFEDSEDFATFFFNSC